MDWGTMTSTEILDDFSTLITDMYTTTPVPDSIWMPFSTWYMLKRLYVKDWLKTRKRNKRRPAFATAWGRTK